MPTYVSTRRQSPEKHRHSDLTLETQTVSFVMHTYSRAYCMLRFNSAYTKRDGMVMNELTLHRVADEVIKHISLLAELEERVAGIGLQNSV